MNIIVHYPSNAKDIKELKRRVATEHANAVTSYLNRLSCSDIQKLNLVKSVQDNLKIERPN